MSTLKEDPNKQQTKDAKTTRPGSLEKSQEKLNKEIRKNEPKKVEGDQDEGVADDQPFDSRTNNIHRKR